MLLSTRYLILLSDVSEFKNALKQLGAKHPQAYEDFVHNIQPSDVRVSRVRVQNADGAGVGLSQQPGVVMMEEPITARVAAGHQTLPPGTTSVQVHKDREKSLLRLIDMLPRDDVWSKVERAMSQVGVTMTTRTIKLIIY